MARNPCHWIGVFFLFAAAILLLVTTISAPVIGDIAILKVELTNFTSIRNSSLTFGTFGYCVLDVPPDSTDQDLCFPKSIGYKPAAIIEEVDKTNFSTASRDSADGLTKAFILHPIACGLAFIAFLLSLGAGVCGSILGATFAFFAWVVAVVAMAIDFVVFGIIKNHVNSDGSGSVASYSYGMWTTVAAVVLLFLGMFIVLFTCCSSRRDRKRASVADPTYNSGYNNGGVNNNGYPPMRKKRFGVF